MHSPFKRPDPHSPFFSFLMKPISFIQIVSPSIFRCYSLLCFLDVTLNFQVRCTINLRLKLFEFEAKPTQYRVSLAVSLKITAVDISFIC
jgi:hypothetical protein